MIDLASSLLSFFQLKNLIDAIVGFHFSSQAVLFITFGLFGVLWQLLFFIHDKLMDVLVQARDKIFLVYKPLIFSITINLSKHQRRIMNFFELLYALMALQFIELLVLDRTYPKPSISESHAIFFIALALAINLLYRLVFTTVKSRLIEAPEVNQLVGTRLI